MIRHDHRHHCRLSLCACFVVVDETLKRLSKRLEQADAWCESRKIELPTYRGLTMERIDSCLDERLRLMRIRDAALAKVEPERSGDRRNEEKSKF